MLTSTKMRISLSTVALILLSINILMISENASALVKQEWAARYGPGIPSAIAVGATGNIYVTGFSALEVYHDGDRWPDWVTIKYDNNGNELWVANYTSPDNFEDRTVALALDAAENIYVTGSSYVTSTTTEYVTIKYDTNGNQQWIARYSGPDSTGNEPSAIAVDMAGNVYVTGAGNGPDSSDYVTIKYDTNGNELWVTRYNFLTEGAKAIALDSEGNVYVTGSSLRLGFDPTDLDGYRHSNDVVTIKYDNAGNELWAVLYSRVERGFSLDDHPIKIAVDGVGNIYVAGFSYDMYAARESNFIVKYDTNGNYQWDAINYVINGYARSSDMAMDAAGNVYLAGSAYGIETGLDFITIKYNTNGDELWTARYTGPGSLGDRQSDTTNAVAVDAEGNAYVTGMSRGPDTSPGYTFDYATIKYDTNGNEIWVTRYNWPDERYSVFGARALAIYPGGNVYVTGDGRTSREPNPTIFTIKLVQTDTEAGNGSNEFIIENGGSSGGCFIETIVE